MGVAEWLSCRMDEETMVVVFTCSYCNFQCYRNQDLIKHTKAAHRNDSNIVLYCNYCGVSYRNWESLRKHVQRKHPEDERNDNVQGMQVSNDDDMNVGDWERSQSIDLEENKPIDDNWHDALFLLRATCEHHLTHDGVDKLAQDVQDYTETVCETVAQRLHTSLDSCGLESNTLSQVNEVIDEACKPGELFKGLKTRYMREKYYKRHFNYEAPITVVMGTSREWVSCNEAVPVLKEISHYGYIIDFVSSLQALLANPAVAMEVSNTHYSSDGLLRDFSDGFLIRNHAVFQDHSDALQIFIYYDDIEVGNPLGSKAGIHKLGCFYYSLGNIRPIYRSTLRSIQLLAIAYTDDIRTYGCEKLLQPFVDNVNKLQDGLHVKINGEEVTLYGTVVCMLGDTPASNFISGFKEGVGFSLRKCRMCLGTREDISQCFHGSDFIRRDNESHSAVLRLIEQDTSGASSTTYGVNTKSVFEQLKGFNVTICFPFDIMHTVFEGVAKRHLTYLLRYLINTKKCCKLQDVNNALCSHPYGYSEADARPTVIKKDSSSSDYHITESASQMMTLIRLLPFMIGHMVEQDDEHWEVFLSLWDICSVCCMFEVPQDMATKLAWMVEGYLEAFVDLYGEVSITPKMHHLVHFPEQIQLFGPLRHQWCMRFESKNAQIKRFVKGNFKNVPLSVAIHHQQWMCSQLAAHPGSLTSNYLYRGDEINGKVGITDPDLSLKILEVCGELSSDSTETLKVLRASYVKIHGIKYSAEAIVRIKSDNVNEGFIYGQINEIIVYKDHKMFHITILEITGIHDHLRSLEIKKGDQHLLVLYEHFFSHTVLHYKAKKNKKYIIDTEYHAICL